MINFHSEIVRNIFSTVGIIERKTKEEKVASLNLMLGQIANHATIISRNQIVKNSVSLVDIWEKIRQHYGFHTTGSRFLDLTALKLNPGERPEDFYQRLVSFIDDNLLTADSTLTHHGSRVTRDEEVTPSLENITTLYWLERIHTNLPGLVKQKYGAELRNKTLASIKPEISAALSSLLDELSAGEDSRILRFQSSYNPRRGRGHFSNSNNRSRSASPGGYSRSSNPIGSGSVGGKSCCLCRAANRPGYDGHFLSQCRYLPEGDRRRLTSPKVRAIETHDNEDDEDIVSNDYNDFSQQGMYNPEHDPNYYNDDEGDDYYPPPRSVRRIPSSRLLPVNRRVTTRKSPRMQCFYRHIPVCLLLDTGAESNLISESTAQSLDLHITPTKQGALQADEITPLAVIGEIKGIKFNKGAHVFDMDALVVKSSMTDIVAGEPFLEVNDIAITVDLQNKPL